MKVVFAGTAEFAVPSLRALVRGGHEVACVLTQPDRRSGRGRKLRQGPIKTVAEELGLAVDQPLSLKSYKAEFLSYNADALIVAAYGLMIPGELLAAPRYGGINVHGSLLPRWRGAAPVQRAIESGDNSTGVTIMQMDEGLDSGDILAVASVPIGHADTAGTLTDKLADLGAGLLLDVLDAAAENRLRPLAQEDAKATYAHKLSKEEGAVNWSEPAAAIARKVRAFHPFPIAWTTDETGARIRIHECTVMEDGAASASPGEVIDSHPENGIRVATGNNTVCILKLQAPGSKPMTAREYLNGRVAPSRFA